MFVRIDVADQGMGIAEQEWNDIFKRFYRSKQAAKHEGVGIGLYLAREIIAAQGGYIKVSSRLGEGTVFSVFLPGM
ncbi:Alkaline phosphatase synthesis sensor protein PhoR [compost metagenome]